MRLARRLVHALLLVLTLLVGATVAVVIVSQTAWFRNWLRGYIVSEADKYLNGTLTIQRLRGNLFYGVELENVGISLDGSEVVAVENLGLDYNVFQLITRGLSIDSLRLTHPVVYLRRDGDSWSIARLLKKQEQEADREGPAFPIAVDEIGISNASVLIDDGRGVSGVDLPDRLDQIDAKLAFRYEPVRYSIEISHLSFRGSAPELTLNSLSGGIAVKDDTLFLDSVAIRTADTSIAVDGSIQHYLSTPQFTLQVTSDRVSLPEVARLIPSLKGVDLQPAFEVRVNGPLDRLGVDMNVRSSAGQLTGQVVADLLSVRQAVQGEVHVRHLDLAPLLQDPAQRTDLTADVRADLTTGGWADLDSLRGTASITAPEVVASGYTIEKVAAAGTLNGRHVDVQARATAYGVAATTQGTVTVPQADDPLTFDLRGTLSRINLSRLPRELGAPRVATDLGLQYHATGTNPMDAHRRRITADALFVDSTVPGARVRKGSTAGVAVNGAAIGYRADATVEQVDLQALGDAFAVPVLADPRHSSAINAHVTAEGSGTRVRAADVTLHGDVTESTVLGGTIPHLAVDVTLQDGAAHVVATGAFAGFDPAVLSGKPAVAGQVAGSLSTDVTIADVADGLAPERVAGSARVSLEPSTVGGLAIESAALDADYRDQSGEIHQFELTGRDVHVNAAGTLALNDTDQSHLTFQADTPRMAEIAALFDVPVSGIAKVYGTITGNRTRLQAKGTLSADALEYQGNGALSVDASYIVDVPDLSVERAAVDADTKATFVTLAGQNVNELTAKTTYADRRVTFEATATQPERRLDAVGALVLHPDHQEVHLTSLGLRAGQQQWTIASGTAPTINYAADTVTVDGLRLQSGAQAIAVDGAFGKPGDALQVTATDIDLAGVDALLLRPPQFTGTLSASARISGSKVAPDVSGQFNVAGGGFRQFRYDTLGGTVSYEAGGVTLDARLQQNATQWVTAKGYLPTSLFSGATEAKPAAGGHIEPATPADRVDLTIESSPLDLGLVQGFTTALTDVTGTVEAHVRVTGSGQDPHPTGTLQVANGGLTVAPTGGVYSHIAGRVDLQDDRVHIDQITVLDNHQSSLSVTGDLAVHAGEVGGFQIWVNSDDFKVIDNTIGNVRLQSAVSLSGQLRAPIVQGYVGLTTGQVNLDELIAIIGASPYPTTAAAPDAGNTTAVIARATPAPAATGPFDALRMNLDLSVPDDLVVKASSLQTPGSPVSLGALNLTLGGDLTARKDPGTAVRLAGAINTVRGTYDFQGRRFEILRDGTVRFEGLDQLNPSLDIRTRRLIQGVEARVNIRGTLEKPEILLSSTPPLEQADILALIVFNQPLNQLGEGQQVSLAQRAQSMAAGAVAGQLAQSIGNALNLDTFEIDVAPENGGGPQLTLGQQVGQNLYVKVQQGIGDQSSTNVVLEYELARWLRLQTNVQQGSSTQESLFRRNQGSGADLIFTFSY
jgi:autotransporter translocation and assembly factor TamB